MSPMLVSSAKAERSAEEQVHRERVLEFEDHWLRYVKQLVGCPADGNFRVSDCRAELGSINASEWLECRRLAKKLFNLRDADEAESRSFGFRRWKK